MDQPADQKRGIVAGVMIFACGSFGLVQFFSDLSPGEPWWLRVLLTGGIYLLIGLSVGALLPRLWPLAVLAGWGPGLLGATGLLMKLRHNDIYPAWSYLAVCLVAVPVSLLLTGYLGALARRRVSATRGRG